MSKISRGAGVAGIVALVAVLLMGCTTYAGGGTEVDSEAGTLPTGDEITVKQCSTPTLETNNDAEQVSKSGQTTQGPGVIETPSSIPPTGVPDESILDQVNMAPTREPSESGGSAPPAPGTESKEGSESTPGKKPAPIETGTPTPPCP